MTIDLRAEPITSNDYATGQYTEATRRISFIQTHEPHDLLPSGRTQLLTHGYQVERVVVLFHGYTSAPQQFRLLGQRLFAQGHNVYLPRAPHHGLPDPMTNEHAQMMADELKQATEQALEIAVGLGEQITVIGLSMGGLMAGWAAQHHAEVDLAMLIAPAVGFRAIPRRLAPVVGKALLRLPNMFGSWGSITTGRPPYTYQRYATRSLGQMLQLSSDLQNAAARSTPAARSIVVVTNANDDAIDNVAVGRLVAAWRQTGASNIRTYEFKANDQLPHDLIDPEQPRQRVDYVYKVLLNLLEQ